MTLEEVQKVTDIILKGVVAAGLAVGTFLVTRDQTNMNKSKLCGEVLQQNFDYVQNNLFTDARKALLDAKLDVQATICGPVDQKLVTVLNNSWRSPSTPREAMNGTDAGAPPKASAAVAAGGDREGEATSGAAASDAPVQAADQPLEVEANLDTPQWVAVARRNDTSFSALNFDVLSGDKARPNTRGNIVRARWFVNIREKNTPVVRGDNKVIGQLLAGQCVRIDASVEGTLNSWARVRRVPCPS